MLTASPDLTIWTDELQGMVTPESGFTAASAIVASWRGKMTASTACLMSDPADDTLIGESVDAPDKPGVKTLLAGTGKWQGISGSGMYQMTAMSKPAADGTFESCLTQLPFFRGDF